MSARQPKRIALAAWLGLLALAIQSLVPALVAAEIEFVARETGENVFTLCVFGHPDLVAHRSDSKSSDSSHDSDDQGTVCPICIALHASAPFTPAIPAALPLPLDRPLDAVAVAAAPAAKNVFTLAYRSRAPPLG